MFYFGDTILALFSSHDFDFTTNFPSSPSSKIKFVPSVIRRGSGRIVGWEALVALLGGRQLAAGYLWKSAATTRAVRRWV